MVSQLSAPPVRHLVVRARGVARPLSHPSTMDDRSESAGMSCDSGVDERSTGFGGGRNILGTGVDAPGSSGRDTGRGSPRRDTQHAGEHSTLGVRVPKRPRPLIPDDEVQPTRAFGASPGTKRALSELMANNLLRLNVSPMDTSSPSGGLSTTPPSDSGVGVSPFGGGYGSVPGTESPREKDGCDMADGATVVTPPPVRVRGFELSSMLDDAGHDQSAPQPRASAAPGGPGTFLQRRGKSILSQQLSGALPVPTPALNSVLPSPSRLLGTLSIEPSSPSAEPSPRGDLRKQAILKRVSMAHPFGEEMPSISRFVTPGLAAPKLMLPAPLREERGGSDEDDDDVDM